MSSWLAAALQLIDSFDLQKNWDSYGAARITRETRDAAKIALAQLSRYRSEPHISPVADGSIQFEWDDGTEITVWRASPQVSEDELAFIAEGRDVSGSKD